MMYYYFYSTEQALNNAISLWLPQYYTKSTNNAIIIITLIFITLMIINISDIYISLLNTMI